MRILPVLFAFALFCSAFLSFSVQPILGKMLLPMVGGAPAAWIVALAFFQLSLLAGYGISYALGRLPVLVHAGGLVALYAAGLYFLPPHLPQMNTHVEGVGISAEVVGMLIKTIFVPFLALTSTTAALQRIFSATKHATAQDPYYLFVASNAGSFVGLFAFPFFFEPFIGMSLLAQYWQLFYVLAFGLIGLALIFAWYFKADRNITDKNARVSAPVSGRMMFKWTMLAFVPCSLSMGVTTLITTDIGGLPLFWVLPLGLYLLTFILAFARKRLVPTTTLQFWHLCAAVLSIFALGMGMWSQMSGGLTVFLIMALTLLGIFFAIAWACHQQLADLRPSLDHLTLYYFILALGGGLAGILHAFVIPFVLNDVIEFSLMVLFSLALHPDFKSESPQHKKMFYTATIVAVLCAVMVWALRKYGISRDLIRFFMVLFMTAGLLVSLTPRLLLIVGLVAFLSVYPYRYNGHVLERERNFFGAHAVFDKVKRGVQVRYLSHGNTIHGVALISSKKIKLDRYQASYYGRGNPIENILDLASAKTLAAVGLGSGQLACYRSSLKVDYYEIDPSIEVIAKKYFPYLNECPVRKIIIGDGRLELSKQKQKYDVILLDAFTSDGIPIHLITREAVQTYRQHLNKNGVILYHVSNRYLNLATPLSSIAMAEKLVAYKKYYIPSAENPLEMPSAWVAIPQTPEQGQELVDIYRWQQLEPGNMVWTDDQSSVLQAVTYGGLR